MSLSIKVANNMDLSDWHVAELAGYWDAEDLSRLLDEMFPRGWHVEAVFGLDYVRPDQDLYDLYLIHDLLTSEIHGEAYKLYTENLRNAQTAYDTFWDAYQGEFNSIEDFAFSQLEMMIPGYVPPGGFRLEVDETDWEQFYMFLEGYVFQNV